MLLMGIFRGRGPHRVCNPHSGTGTGDSMSPRAFTGTGSGRSPANGEQNVLSISGGDNGIFDELLKLGN